MTQDEIIEMAKEAGLTSVDKKSQYLRDCLERFAKLVAEKATEEANARSNASWTLMCKKMVEAEREACAKVCEAERILGIDDERAYYGELMAAAIRARGQE
jgi:hypothetical protein